MPLRRTRLSCWLPLLGALALLLSLWPAGRDLPARAAPAYSVPVPTNLAAAPDDRAAVLTWNAVIDPAHSDPAGVHGYRVTWGPTGNPSAHVALVGQRIIEAQPLTNGDPYVATIQAVDNDGNLSAPSAPLSFTGDSSRVDALRTQMTGFFDDFNDPALSMLAPDARKWNTAVSYCSDDPATEGMFVNDQSHVHNLVNDNHCDRGQNDSRPRATLDLSSLRTITFDLDGAQRRDFWYLDLAPRVIDTSGDTTTEGQPGALSGTANMLRFKQAGQDVSIFWIDSSGVAHQLASSSSGNSAIAWAGLTLTPNVRRHWTLHVSQTHADISINGHLFASTDALAIPYTQATPLWSLFSYNTRKSAEDRVLLHWDNFGWDGPAPTTETHSYIDAGCCGGGDFAPDYGTTITRAITIPDSLAGESAERVLFDLQMEQNHTYAWNAADTVTVNGASCPVAQPGPSTIPQTSLVSVITPYTASCDLPLGTLHTGTNTLAFHLANSGFLNVHVEVDFPEGGAPSYTQPGLSGMPMGAGALPDIGPGAIINTIGTASTFSNQHGPFTVSGQVPIAYQVNEGAALDGNGKIVGISRVQLSLDGNLLLDRHTDAQVPAPTVSDTYTLDTTALTNGTHLLRLAAWDALGTAAIPDYFDGSGYSGEDWPITLIVNNPTPTATNTATATSTGTVPPTLTSTATPVPTDTPTAPATDTPLPTATATATPVPSDTPTAVPTSTSTPPDTQTPIPTATATATATASETATKTPVDTDTATATETPTDTDTPVPTDTATATPTSTSTDTPTPTSTPVVLPPGDYTVETIIRRASDGSLVEDTGPLPFTVN